MEAVWIRFHLFFIFAGFLMLWDSLPSLFYLCRFPYALENTPLLTPKAFQKLRKSALSKSPPLTMIS